MPSSTASFSRRVLVVAAIVLLVVLGWQLLDLFVLVFGAVLGAVVLRAIATALERRARVPHPVSVPAGVLLLIGLAVAVAWLVGQPLAEQLDLLRERLPQALHQFIVWLGSHRIGIGLLQLWQEARSGNVPWARLATFAGLTLGALGSAALMLVMAIYFAADPKTYHHGLLKLLPHASRDSVDHALRDAAAALRRWLKGQALSMLFIGASTTVGLALLGAPLALALGLISGLLAFVPFFGAIVGGLLAVLVAFIEGPRTALYVAILVLAIQQAEEYVVLPLVQRWAVRLPPVLGLAAAIVFGVLFGLPGVLLATPMMVVAMVLVQRLYVEEVIENRKSSTGRVA